MKIRHSVWFAVMAASLMAGVQVSRGDGVTVPSGIHATRPYANYVLMPTVSGAEFKCSDLSATVKNPNHSPQTYTPVFTGKYNRCEAITNMCNGSTTHSNGYPCFETCAKWNLKTATIKMVAFTIPANGTHHIDKSIPNGEQPFFVAWDGGAWDGGGGYLSPVTLAVGGTKVNMNVLPCDPR